MSDWPSKFDQRNGTTAPVVLAHELPFRLGALQVEPALRLVSTDDGREEILQPRTMQVLVSLARSAGKILSRDDLTESCWSGTLVGDDSINRVIAQLRKLADGIGDQRFAIETITKVGYRLIVLQDASAANAAGHLPAIAPTAAPAATPAGTPAVAPIPNRPLHKRPLMIAGVAAAILLAIVTAVITGVSLWPASAANDGVAELAIATSAGPGTPPGAAQALHDELASVFGPDQLRIIDDPRGGTYRLDAKLAEIAGELVVFAELRPPGGGPAIWAPRLPVRDAKTLKGVASFLIFAARCDVSGDVMHAPVNRSPVAVAAWAGFCDENSKDTYDNGRQIELLRTATRAEPRFADAHAMLAFALGEEIGGRRDPQAEALRAEGRRAAAAALALDPRNGMAHLALASMKLPRDFFGREAETNLALQARPEFTGQAIRSQGTLLFSVGRLKEALAAYRRALVVVTDNNIDLLASARLLSAMGDYGSARQIYATHAGSQNDSATTDRLWLNDAIAARDWEQAKILAPIAVIDDATRAAMIELVAGLAAGDTAKVRGAGATFEGLASHSATLTLGAAYGLAYSGRRVAALSAVERLVPDHGTRTWTMLYSTAFAPARQTPEFAALVERNGLADYWRNSGNLPDFCLSPGAPALCATLRRRG